MRPRLRVAVLCDYQHSRPNVAPALLVSREQRGKDHVAKLTTLQQLACRVPVHMFVALMYSLQGMERWGEGLREGNSTTGSI